jgi:hypothetical protein
MPTGSTARIETAWAAAVRRLGYRYQMKWCMFIYNTIKYKVTPYTGQSILNYIGLY